MSYAKYKAMYEDVLRQVSNNGISNEADAALLQALATGMLAASTQGDE